MKNVRPSVPLRPDVVARKRQERELRFQEMAEKAKMAERNERLGDEEEKETVTAATEKPEFAGEDVMDQDTDSIESMIEAEDNEDNEEE